MKLKTLFNEARSDPKNDGIGDYPLLHKICGDLIKNGVKVSRTEMVNVLKGCSGKEFSRISIDSELIKELSTPSN